MISVKSNQQICNGIAKQDCVLSYNYMICIYSKTNLQISALFSSNVPCYKHRDNENVCYISLVINLVSPSLLGLAYCCSCVRMVLCIILGGIEKINPLDNFLWASLVEPQLRKAKLGCKTTKVYF